MKRRSLGKAVAMGMALAMVLTAGTAMVTKNSANASTPTQATVQEETGSLFKSKDKKIKLTQTKYKVDMKTNSTVEWQEGGLTPKPEVRCGCDGTLLKENEDYSLEYKNNYDVGTATVYVKGMGKYKGTIKAQFIIEGIDIDCTQVYETAKVVIACRPEGRVRKAYVTEVLEEFNR